MATKNLAGGLNRTKESLEYPTLQLKTSFTVNKQSLTQKITLLNNLENIISNQECRKIINLTQLKMANQTELAVYLNYKRGKYKHSSLMDMIGKQQPNNSNNNNRKTSYAESPNPKIPPLSQILNSIG